MTGSNESVEEFEAKMAAIREAGPQGIVDKIKRRVPSRKPKSPNPEVAASPLKPIPPRNVDTLPVITVPEPISYWEEIPPKAQKEIDRIDRRTEMGMGFLPWKSGDEGFVPLDSDPNMSISDIIEIVANWFVRKDLKYYDVWNQGQSLIQADVEQIVNARLKEQYPTLKLSRAQKKDLFTQLFDGDSDPGCYFKVWSGKARSIPGNRQRLIYRDGTVDINTWISPKYRRMQVEPDLGAFKELLEFSISEEAEREMLLDWLAWCLQNEHSKPSWAVFLYSDEKGTGKSTIADIARALFGKDNTAAINGIDKLVGRFNKSILDKKLVVAEEVQIPPNSPKGNALKDLITGQFATVEEKGRETEEVEHNTCLLLTTNHKPIWLEAGERRYYILHISHEGHAQGPKREKFIDIVSRLKDNLKSPTMLAGIYQALLQRTVSPAFNPHSLDFETQATKVMREIEGLSPDQTQETLRDVLEAYSVVAIPGIGIPKLLKYLNMGSMNAPKYLFDRIGWEKRRLAWSGGKTADIWVKKGTEINRGKIFAEHETIQRVDEECAASEGWVPLGQHLDNTWGRLVKEVLDLKRNRDDPGSRFSQFDAGIKRDSADQSWEKGGAECEVHF